MAYLKTEEKEDKGITITPVSQKILENIDILNNLLTPLELWIIDTLKEPRTVKEIRDLYIIEQGKNFNIRMIRSQKIEKTLKGIAVISIPKSSKEIEKQLKAKKIKIPSYEKFDNILFSLEKLGITARRYDILKKGKWLWILNPNFLIALKESKKRLTSTSPKP